MALLADAHRVQPDLFPDAFRGAERDAPAYVHLSQRTRLRDLEPDRDRRVVPPGGRVPGVPVQHLPDLAPAAERSRRPLEWGDARMGDPLASAGVQLCPDPGGARAGRALGSQARA